MQVEEVLKLIRAMKTFNLSHVKLGELELNRNVEQTTPNKIESPQLPEEVKKVLGKRIGALQEELDDIEEENLLISDPEEYEKRMNNV